MQERMMQENKEDEKPVDVSGLYTHAVLSGEWRPFDSRMIVARRIHSFPEWTEDEAFMRIVYASMPAVYERYKDPENRAKGEPDLTARDAIKYMELAAYEAIEVLDEWKKHREGDGDPKAIRHELGDMTLTGMFAAACWDDLCRKLTTGVYAEHGK